ncbi:malonate decarboxylase subunit delta [Massilia sp. WF1]|uniref:malonate decarboxylase acyl carrier protein n=1 Tax=unclassified Massilia TaxID=2609279 RepID=UPI000649525D|nr:MULTISPECIES: malonate decarboxylase acyl carrier protein [unclassified Massilia]ALK95486.1 malonate decarboxylase acyl carrier protein [Massilia sp. WG5]KLU34936.1 malonate decarboxylase subunit delta [Massilia sp. WF1]
METLRFNFSGGQRRIGGARLVGVVGSGNLEVMIEQQPLDGACEVEISTAAHGFGPIWEAVVRDFHQRWQLADVRVSINDMGATPAVVSLRLDQAAESITGSISGDAS